MKRGVVLSPAFTKLPTGDVMFKSAVDDLELHKYLTYWDIIDVPRNSYINFDCHQFRFLEETGYLQRTNYGDINQHASANISDCHRLCLRGNVSAIIDDCTDITISSHAGNQIINAHEDVFMLRNASSPGQWSKAQVSDKVVASEIVNKPGIEIELYNYLPIPSIDTPLDDIIKFKESRADELQAFRCYLDEVYQNIISAADVPRARITAINNIERAVKDIHTTLHESRIKTLMGTLRSVVSDTSGVVGLGLTAAGVSMFGMSPLVTGLSFTGLAIASKVLTQSKKDNNSDFVYLKSVSKEFDV
ncbi:DUF6236 family protein [Serratia fonticola]